MYFLMFGDICMLRGDFVAGYVCFIVWRGKKDKIIYNNYGDKKYPYDCFVITNNHCWYFEIQQHGIVCTSFLHVNNSCINVCNVF